MNEEVKETVLMVADYSNEEKVKLLKRIHILFIVGMIGFVTDIVIRVLGLENTTPYDAIAGFGSGVAFGMLVVGVIFTSKYALKIRNTKLRLLQKK